ncbi:MAG: CotH kinase family protein [Clostridia bacterium]|nr:CotH kinase family protein [Clostridia bacterium]
MKKRLVPIFIVILLTLLSAVWWVRTASDGDPVTGALRFSVPCGTVTVKTAPWKSEDGSYYVFLPSCSSLSEVRPIISGHSGLSIAGTPLTENTDLSVFRTGVPYDLTVERFRSETKTKLVFLQSSGISSVFISTESGSMRRIDADKTHEEAAAVILLDKSGTVIYAGGGKDKIHGRGNTTWALEKKPYHLTLDSAQDLLGTGPSRHWILLANALDRTNLRNRIVHDATGFAGLAWTPSCDYVDVYLNGAYNGLYLLSERIETGDGRLDIDPAAGGFLFEITNKPSDEDLSFRTRAHRTVRLREPEACTDAQLEAIRNRTQQMETAIRGLPDAVSWLDVLDLDSFAARFLIDEFFLNMDSDMASSFYYWDPAAGKMFAGPVWDYDLSCGSTANIWSAQSRYPDQIFAIGKFYYRLLYNTPVFREKVVRLYRDTFLPSFTDYLSQDLPALQNRIRDAAVMNDTRWTRQGNEPASQTADGLYQFFSRRIGYLQDAWIEGIPYCSVWFCDAGKTVVNHLSFPVNGDVVSLPSPLDLGIGSSSVWYVKDTDQVWSTDEAEPGEIYLSPISETDYNTRPQSYTDFGDEEQQDIGVLDYVKRVLRHNWQIVLPFACFLILLAVLVLYLIHESFPPQIGDKRL